jgi:Putative lumazine-binding
LITDNRWRQKLDEMKSLFFTIFLVCAAPGLKSQTIQKMKNDNADSVAIAAVLENLYFKGIYQGNLDLLNQVYYKGTLLFGDVKGQPYAKTLEQYLDGVKNRQSPKDSGKPFKGEILSIKLVNSIAVAEVKVKMYDFNYQEFLSFHKLDGRWLIVNKMISDISE